MVDNLESIARAAMEKLFEELLKKENGFRLAINVPDLAKLLGINATKAYGLVKTQNFPQIKIGNRIIIPVLALLSWLETKSFEN